MSNDPTYDPDRQVIPAEAVEAAARVLAQPAPYNFDAYPQYWMERPRRALEAAAPYMLALAWEWGEAAGQDNAAAYQTGGPVASNPYGCGQ